MDSNIDVFQVYDDDFLALMEKIDTSQILDHSQKVAMAMSFAYRILVGLQYADKVTNFKMLDSFMERFGYVKKEETSKT